MTQTAWHGTDPLWEIERRVREHPGRPVVVADLDLTAVHSRARAGRARDAATQPHGITGLDRLPLPGLYDGAWAHWVDQCGIRRRWPDLDWGEIGRDYRRKLDWGEDALFQDDLAEGLKSWVAHLTASGARVVAITGRPDWMCTSTERVLARHGIPIEVHTAIRSDPHSSGEAQIPGGKIARLREIAPLSDVVAMIDDSAANLAAVERHCPDALAVGFAARAFLSDPGLVAYPCISSFVPDVEAVLL